jgi:hypothetical protein
MFPVSAISSGCLKKWTNLNGDGNIDAMASFLG